MTETGHSKNVANFAKVITFSTGCRADHDPTNPASQFSHRRRVSLSSRFRLFTDNAFRPAKRCRESQSLAVANHHPINKQIISG